MEKNPLQFGRKCEKAIVCSTETPVDTFTHVTVVTACECMVHVFQYDSVYVSAL